MDEKYTNFLHLALEVLERPEVTDFISTGNLDQLVHVKTAIQKQLDSQAEREKVLLGMLPLAMQNETARGFVKHAGVVYAKAVKEEDLWLAETNKALNDARAGVQCSMNLIEALAKDPQYWGMVLRKIFGYIYLFGMPYL